MQSARKGDLPKDFVAQLRVVDVDEEKYPELLNRG